MTKIIERFSHFRWFYRAERGGNHGYAVRHGKKTDATTTVYMHREVVGQVPPGHEAIFLNFDRLDCRRENLRVVTKDQARQHHRVRKDCQAGHKGMHFNHLAKTYSVDILVDGRMKRIGTFDSRGKQSRNIRKPSAATTRNVLWGRRRSKEPLFRQQTPNPPTCVSQRKPNDDKIGFIETDWRDVGP